MHPTDQTKRGCNTIQVQTVFLRTEVLSTNEIGQDYTGPVGGRHIRKKKEIRQGRCPRKTLKGVQQVRIMSSWMESRDGIREDITR